jgi:hypothetical protein
VDQCVQPDHSRLDALHAADVERGARRGRDRHPAAHADLVVDTCIAVQVMPSTLSRPGRLSSAGSSASTKRAPCSAAAEIPATTARRLDHSQAATALSIAVSWTPRGT